MSNPQSTKGRTEAFLRTRLPEEDTANITGNTPVEIKELPVKWLAVFRGQGTGFAGTIGLRNKVVDVSVVKNPDDPLKGEGKVVCEIEVTPDMCNGNGHLSEGCTVYLIDECSTLSMVVINAHAGQNGPPGVSMTINTFHHSPAPLGTMLRIVSTSLSSGHETNSGKCEIWDKENHRLIASGTQQTMIPSRPGPRMKENPALKGVPPPKL